jgi:hypothetical protein
VSRIGLAALIACAASAIVALPASAGAPPVPVGFRLAASHGYAINAVAFDGEQSEQPDALLLFVHRKHQAALYAASAGVAVTETTIRADLGGLGKIDVEFVPTGRVWRERSSCGLKPIGFAGGYFRGELGFHGEEDFTDAEASRARGENGLILDLLCGGPDGVEGIGGHSPGAWLSVRRRTGRTVAEFSARKNSPTRPARFEASVEERRRGLQISRGVEAMGTPDDFVFDVPKQSALINPPPPFTGTGRFRGAGPGPGRLFGALAVDFPGRADVRLGGARTRGGLIRAVQNPSHPFRLSRPNLLAWPSTKLSPIASAMSSLLEPS